MSDSTVYSTSITPGAPPLRWDNIHEAFRQVNANFEILEAALGASGITPINFSDLDSSVIPSTGGTYQLGSLTKAWKHLWVSEYAEVLGNELNGVWLGQAQIKGIGYTVDLPANSTIDGDLIIDPAKTWFQTVQIDNNESIVATQFNDSFSILSGTGISMNVDSSAESVTVTNTGIITASAGSGISVSGTNPLTITNTGVRSLTNSGAIGTRTPGLGIHVSSSTGTPLITNTGVLSVSQGVGITVSLDAVTGDVTVSNSAPAVNAFTQIEVDGDIANRLQADAVSDVLNISSGYGISLSKIVATDTLTIAVNPVHDIKGSVFGDDSSVLVDGVNNYIYGNVSATTLRTAEAQIALGESAAETNQGTQAIAIGRYAGQTNQGLRGIAIGHQAATNGQGQRGIAIGTAAGATNQGAFAIAMGQDCANTNQGTEAIALGTNAGQVNQGTYAIAIGYSAASSGQGTNAIAIGRSAVNSNQTAGSIVLNATGTAVTAAAAGFYIDPVRSTTSSARPIVYDTTTKELFYTSTLEFINSTISTTDSSGLTVDVQTTFNTDVTFENDVLIKNRLTVNGELVGYVRLSAIKSAVAASVDFADFKTRIAAL